MEDAMGFGESRVGRRDEASRVAGRRGELGMLVYLCACYSYALALDCFLESQ